MEPSGPGLISCFCLSFGFPATTVYFQIITVFRVSCFTVFSFSGLCLSENQSTISRLTKSPCLGFSLVFLDYYFGKVGSEVPSVISVVKSLESVLLFSPASCG